MTFYVAGVISRGLAFEERRVHLPRVGGRVVRQPDLVRLRRAGEFGDASRLDETELVLVAKFTDVLAR